MDLLNPAGCSFGNLKLFLKVAGTAFVSSITYDSQTIVVPTVVVLPLRSSAGVKTFMEFHHNTVHISCLHLNHEIVQINTLTLAFSLLLYTPFLFG